MMLCVNYDLFPLISWLFHVDIRQTDCLWMLQKFHFLLSCLRVLICLVKCHYRIYPKYSDTLNVRTRYFFLKRHLFYVPYISGHVPNRVFLLSINVRTQKNRSLISHKTFIFSLPKYFGNLLCLPVFLVVRQIIRFVLYASNKICCRVAF